MGLGICGGREGEETFIVGTRKQPEDVLESEWVGDFLTFSSIVGGKGGRVASSQIASTRNDEALSNDEPSTVIV